MTDTFKVLGQVAPSANTATTLYTVPAATSTTVSSIVVCNQNPTSITFSIWVAVNGSADDGYGGPQYLYYNVPCTGNNTFVATMGITLGYSSAGDIIRVQASSADVSFNAFGVQIT